MLRPGYFFVKFSLPISLDTSPHPAEVSTITDSTNTSALIVLEINYPIRVHVVLVHLLLRYLRFKAVGIQWAKWVVN